MKQSTAFSIAAITFLVVVATVTTMSFELHELSDERKPFAVKNFTLDGPGNVEVRTSGGSITVKGGEGKEARVEMYVRVRGKTITPDHRDAKEIMDDYNITIDKSGNTIYARAERENSISGWFGNNHASISFVVYTPREVSCSLSTSGGSIEISGVRGGQKLETSGGSVRIEDIRGQTDARTSGGSIKINGYSGTLTAHTSGGSIDLANSQGDLKVNTSGGSIDITNVTGAVEASTSGGGIRADVTKLEKHLKLRTSGGSITAVIPQGLGLDLDLRGSRVNSRLVNFNGEADKDRIRGAMNGGGIPVVMHTSGGSINLEYR
ncbi:MAG: DUF4097 family beta strand repeat-containing protein [Bacteroidota bacterium]|jgi:DUF4097 and DUF4098 domain-containing protein YvlB|nr:MAG: hypothetical protein DIU61_00630 [Bacteroidota bacterium]